ncbi:MAG: acetoacetate--CoA ligase [Candidatus Marinimicrobia bacterium]|jgi:acetoacetyl-CoA synthetase|nr:acetoacetate--CoA ligase [Candidatus Neomarinimicrobiota bacterium]MBT3632461.1 acetoacetate--CoA ligase [Candidatus Neomarinimicrobiota bacterium]MBT3826048.1 acetoacetate--CoA ligase [Candidatus Neomarinimicrobiota bacterium]MBT4132284.1 acetoacetate--CoA ligase [Candidatus Neomarinimicrobiota bacterium]MBT4296569.1 acetoacetate--CoA ligase [Candidatus Neomarinimicrobiota bacterium]
MTNKVMWTPNEDQVKQAQITQFRHNLNTRYGVTLNSYADLYQWSLNNAETFWGEIWKLGEIISSTRADTVVDDLHKMPGARWFQGSRLNYAENLLRYRDERIAIHFRGEDQVQRSLTYAQLYEQVAHTAQAMQDAGVTQGDRIAGFIPNLPETIIAMLAASSLGAIWSSSSPDFGIKGVLDRFTQIEPKIIFAADGYFYGGKRFDSLEKLQNILHDLPSVEKVVVISYTQTPDLSSIPNSMHWDDFVDNNATEVSFTPLPFDHPLYIMYSSGTTGLPKSIVHSAGGTLIQHLKELMLHCDLRREDTIFYFTTCGWMMWNWLVSSLAVGATLVLYDGNPFYPGPEGLWKMAEELDISVFGTSAKYLDALEAAGCKPGQDYKLSALRAVLSTGSPLSEESFDFVYSDIKQDLLLASISGGTDIVSCFVLGNPVLPVHRGELQCRGLGMQVEAFDDSGQGVFNENGELVCTLAFPSMPVFFWNDPDGQKYHSAYFADYPGIWRHGDFIEINDHGGVRIYGRSDATLNPGGVRIGTAEIYTVVENLPEIVDSLVVGQAWQDDERIILFVKLPEGDVLDEALVKKLKVVIRQNCSPRHVPAIILKTTDIPYTINGKKVEIAVKKIIRGQEVQNRSALANPESLDLYKNLERLHS